MTTVRATFERWIEDRLFELKITRDEFANQIGTSTTYLTRVINDPSKATLEIVVKFGEVLQCEDWYEELVSNWGMGTDRATLKEWNQLLQPEGAHLGRLQNVA